MKVPWYLMAKGKGGGGYKTASGPIVSISDALAAPLRSLRMGIDPVQAGTGDPSPDNVRPISGWSAVNVWRTGKNLLDESLIEQGTITNFGPESEHTRCRTEWDSPIFVAGGTVYTVSGNTASGTFNVFVGVYADKTTTTRIAKSGWITSGQSYTIPSGGVYVRMTFRRSDNANVTPSDFSNVQLELGSTATPYEPYSGSQYTIQLGDTIYGGTLDVTNGVLMVDRVMQDMTSFSWTYDGQRWQVGNIADIKNYTARSADIIFEKYATNTAASVATEYAGFTVGKAIYIYTSDATNSPSGSVVYYLAIPITIPLTPQEISTLKGKNNLWADSGDVTVEYLSSGGANPDLMKLAVAFMGR